MHKTGRCLWFSLALLSAIFLMEGCRSPRQPVPHSSLSYRRQALSDVLADLVVRINMRDCPEYQVMRYKTWYGTTSTEVPHDLQGLLRDEFMRAVANNFTPVDGVRVRLAKVELNLTVNRIDLYDPYIGDARCSYEMTVKLVDPRSNDTKPFFEKVYTAERHSAIEDGQIPDCEYAAIRQIVTDFVNDLSKNREVIQLLDDRNREIPPEISDWQPRHLQDGAIRGHAYVSCNDWNMEATAGWARKQIFKRAASEMRLPEELDAVRVFYFRESYEESTGRWDFEFDVCPASALIVLPRSKRNWNRGRCYIDVKLIKARDGNQAVLIARKQVLKKALSEGAVGTTVVFRNDRRHKMHTNVIVADYEVK